MVSFREELKKKLTKKEQSVLRAGFDVIGDIAILEIPRELEKKAKLMGQTLLKIVPSVKVVCARIGKHKGRYRLQKMVVLAGEKRFIALHKESGIQLKLDVAKCYFSPRLGSERLRIASQIKPSESILVVGAGVGPYPLVFARNSKAKHIVGVELNPVACKYAIENVALNKLKEKVEIIKADIRKLKLSQKFDRVVMAMPHLGVSYVPFILKYAKKGAFLHVLDFAHESELNAPAEKLLNLCKKLKRSVKIIKTVKTGDMGVRRYRVCVDARIN